MSQKIVWQTINLFLSYIFYYTLLILKASAFFQRKKFYSIFIYQKKYICSKNFRLSDCKILIQQTVLLRPQLTKYYFILLWHLFLICSPPPPLTTLAAIRQLKQLFCLEHNTTSRILQYLFPKTLVHNSSQWELHNPVVGTPKPTTCPKSKLLICILVNKLFTLPEIQKGVFEIYVILRKEVNLCLCVS